MVRFSFQRMNLNFFGESLTFYLLHHYQVIFFSIYTQNLPKFNGQIPIELKVHKISHNQIQGLL